MLIDVQKLVKTDKDCTPLLSKAFIKNKSVSINTNFESIFFRRTCGFDRDSQKVEKIVLLRYIETNHQGLA